MIKIIVFNLALLLTIAVVPCAAEEPDDSAQQKKQNPSIGEAIGNSAREITETSKSIYKGAKKAVMETGRQAAEGAKETYKKAKKAGGDVIEDVKSGYEKGSDGEKAALGEAKE